MFFAKSLTNRLIHGEYDMNNKTFYAFISDIDFIWILQEIMTRTKWSPPAYPQKVWWYYVFRCRPLRLFDKDTPRILCVVKYHPCLHILEFPGWHNYLVYSILNLTVSYLWLDYECKLGHSDPTPIKCELDISCNLLSIHTDFKVGISKIILTTRRKTIGGLEAHYISVYWIWRIYVNSWGHECSHTGLPG